jgi:hypothetical protein
VKWTYSALDQYTKCPRQYHEIRVLRNFKVETTEQILYGREVHKALENYAKNNTPLVKNYEQYQPVLDVLLAQPGNKYFEHNMALDQNKQPCEYWSNDHWVRGTADLLIIDGHSALIVDYKTGSAKYPDTKQLKLMALMAFANFPEIKTIRAALWFALHDVLIDETYNRNDVDSLWGSFAPDLMRFETSARVGAWPANPTPLCGWCSVKSCEFQFQKDRRR